MDTKTIGLGGVILALAIGNIYQASTEPKTGDEYKGTVNVITMADTVSKETLKVTDAKTGDVLILSEDMEIDLSKEVLTDKNGDTLELKDVKLDTVPANPVRVAPVQYGTYDDPGVIPMYPTRLYRVLIEEDGKIIQETKINCSAENYWQTYREIWALSVNIQKVPDKVNDTAIANTAYRLMGKAIPVETVAPVEPIGE